MRFNRIPLPSRILSSLDRGNLSVLPFVAIRLLNLPHVMSRRATLSSTKFQLPGNAEPKIGLNFLFSFHRQLQKFTSMYQDQFRKAPWNVRGARLSNNFPTQLQISRSPRANVKREKCFTAVPGKRAIGNDD